MAKQTLDERVTALEQQFAKLRQALTNGLRKKDWRRTIGMFTGDETMKRIDEEARKYREADRRKARGPQTRSRRASP